MQPLAASREPIQGYTPANYISYTEEEQHRCHHLVAVDVDAPPSVCFGLWDDWSRVVDYMDLVSQIGLDPSEPQMGLFQCFYRWGRMPIMEIVFLARKTQVELDEMIRFETVWGMPAVGEVQFVEGEDGSKTTVIFKLSHQMPWLLVDLKIGTISVETQLRQVFTENLAQFKAIAEADAAAAGLQGVRTPKRQGGPKPAGSTPGGASSSSQGPAQGQDQQGSGERGTGQKRTRRSSPPASPGSSSQQQPPSSSPPRSGSKGRGRSKSRPISPQA